ncbi:MAG TPA: hypothetical protein VJA21_11095 [Verrucomicrobiae bacterium]
MLLHPFPTGLYSHQAEAIAMKKANRRIYALLSALQGYGDLGQLRW